MNNNQKKIAIFGASVTSQSNGSGYVDCLTELLRPIQIELLRFSHPSCHFNDAGYFFHDRVLNANPSICIFEWNTTGLGDFSEEKLSLVINSMLERNISIGFLILPRVGINTITNRNAENQIIELAKRHTYPILDLRSDFDASRYLRDDVHTNSEGAIYYADKIYKWLISANFKPQTDSNAMSINNLMENKHKSSINHFDSRLIVRKKLAIEFFLPDSALSEIAISVIVGPHSPLTEISIVETGQKFKRSFWDQWCNYERSMLISLTEYSGLKRAPKNHTYTLLLEILPEDPQYSKCKHDIKFPISELRFIDINEIHTSDLEIIKIHSDGIEITS